MESRVGVEAFDTRLRQGGARCVQSRWRQAPTSRRSIDRRKPGRQRRGNSDNKGRGGPRGAPRGLAGGRLRGRLRAPFGRRCGRLHWRRGTEPAGGHAAPVAGYKGGRDIPFELETGPLRRNLHGERLGQHGSCHGHAGEPYEGDWHGCWPYPQTTEEPKRAAACACCDRGEAGELRRYRGRRLKHCRGKASGCTRHSHSCFLQSD
mmetsp:Transcript_57264/g.186172  ORF Transcript_57264/g.186172 Transcript_57264/m.186172 type:complete len:206 (+) Transcript_57264:285-902(+)